MAWLSWAPGRGAFAAGRGVSEWSRVRVLRGVLLAAQTAVAMTLLVAGSYLLRSYAELTGQDVGFAADTVVVSVLPPPERTPAAARQELELTLARLAGLPSVRGASAAKVEVAANAAQVVEGEV